MKKQLTEEHQNQLIGHLIKKEFYIGGNTKLSIFLCGGDVANHQSGRHQFSQFLAKAKNVDVFYPEDLFDDLLAGQGQHSLLSLENILAEAVDVIILFPESPGSLTELGAFSNNESLRKKLICIQDVKFKSKRSFINYGPIRLLRSFNSSSVLRYHPDELAELCSKPFKDLKSSFLYKGVTRAINRILKAHKVDKGIGNLLYVDRFILPCIYLLEDISFRTLLELTSKAIKQDEVLSKIIVRSTLTRLINQRKILRTINGYQVTPVGANYVRNVFDRKRLDGLRLEIMNFENRRRSTFNYDKIPYVHP
ncbi:retron St85 family effector protein [Enterobacter ludwigii]|jgi:hypothetical protein|uniref:retron St85 family effector protein n=1 Tax=Enterobacter ludwigii TaxID=299767 RepID=UPI002787EBBE|nr:retron St85 family effector protein [Enterobacter ludwigii]MDP9945396.1 hypothetical protein [Enterobacter ludwigii]